MTQHGFNYSSIQFAFKTLWPQTRIQDEVYKSTPSWRWCPERELRRRLGVHRAPDWRLAGPVAAILDRADHFGADRRRERSSNRGSRFLPHSSQDYQIVNLDTEAMLASQGEGALLKSLDVEMRGAVRNPGQVAGGRALPRPDGRPVDGRLVHRYHGDFVEH